MFDLTNEDAEAAFELLELGDAAEDEGRWYEAAGRYQAILRIFDDPRIQERLDGAVRRASEQPPAADPALPPPEPARNE